MAAEAEREAPWQAELEEDVRILTDIIDQRDQLWRTAPRSAEAERFLKRADELQFHTADMQELYQDMRWLYQFMNNSVVNDFVRRFVYCKPGPVPRGMIPGAPLLCHTMGVRGQLALRRREQQAPPG